MQNELPAVSDRPIQPENLKPVLITRLKVGETRQLEREPGSRGTAPGGGYLEAFQASI